MSDIDRRRLGLFFGSLLALAAGVIVIATTTDIDRVVIGLGYVLTPMIAGLTVCLYSGISLSSVGLRIGRQRWLVAASVLAFVLVVLSALVSAVAPGVTLQTPLRIGGYEVLEIWTIDLPGGSTGVFAAIGVAVATGVTLQAVLLLGEEFGWRGYLLWELAPLGFWPASVAIGIVWALWHAPTAFVWGPETGATYAMLGWLLALPVMSPIYTYVVVRARSVLAAALFHGVFNATAGLTAYFIAVDSGFGASLVFGPVGIAGAVTFGLLVVAIAVTGPPQLSREFATETRAGGEAKTAPRTKSETT